MSSDSRGSETCCVLGGGGFMGAHLCEALLRSGHQVRAFERPVPEGIRAAREGGPIEWVYGDFANEHDIARAVSGCTTVFHLVSTTLPKNSNENSVYDVQTNVVGSIQLLEAARRAGVRRIFFASSGGTVYGRPETVPIQESHPTQPLCSYGITKLAIEKYLHLYHELFGLDYLILRLANPFGPGQRLDAAQGAIPVFLSRALRDEVIDIWGDGSVVRDYIYIEDVVRVFVAAMNYSGDRQVLNVGAGRGYSLNDILVVMEELLGRPVARRYLPARPFDVPVNVLDSSLARELLDWAPRVDLRDGMRRTLEWLRDASPTGA